MKAVVKRAAATAALALTMAQAGAGMAGSNSYGIGIEGFNDRFKQPDIGSTGTTTYGSMTGYFSHQWANSFIALDLRGSYGTERYSAPDDFDISTFPVGKNYPLPAGNVSGVPQWEFELRARYGRTYQVWDGDLSPYIGIGARYHSDQGKGYMTDLSFLGSSFEDFDTNTWQFYVPVGASYAFFLGDGWSIVPLAEGDILFYGSVNQRVTNTTVYGRFSHTADNTQSFGLGGRGELMFGKDMGGYTIAIGPFIRYWWVQKSDESRYDGLSTPVFAPESNRTQIGGALKVLW